MKILIAITSCAKDMTNGNNQALRDTWIKKIPFFKEFDYKFFIGTGYPKPLDQELPNFQQAFRSLEERCPELTVTPKPLDSWDLVGDEVLLDVPDGYPYLPYKMRESRRWALNAGYDYVFKCDVDVYVHIARLKNCGFEVHDYVGYESPLLGPEVEMLKEINHELSGTYAGGVGYWLSRKACEILANAPINILPEDVWTGYNLYINGIHLHNDYHYCYYIGDMQNAIVVHLGGVTGEYDNKKMYETSILFDKYRVTKPIAVIKRPNRFLPRFRQN